MERISVAHMVSLATVGGVERFFTNFATNTGDAFEHHVFLSTDTVHEYFEQKLKDSGVKLHSVRRLGPIYLPKSPGFIRKAYLKRIIKKNNIQALVLWNKLEKFPVSFPKNLKLIHFERGSAWLVKNRPNVKKHLDRCHAILANSAAGIELLNGRWGLSPDIQTKIVHNGVNPDFTKSDAPVKTKNDVIRLGFAGRFVPLKGWILALMALRELNTRKPGGYKLVVGGEGRQKELFKKFASEWNLNAHIEDMGLVKDMPDFFNKIDIFLHTSLREPFGNVAVEAQALGCPVVGGWMDGNPEIIQDGKTGILLPMEIDVMSLKDLDESFTDVPELVWDPLIKKLRKPFLMDPKKMADAVETISKDSQTLETYSSNASKFIRETYSFGKRAEALKNTLKEII